MTNYRCIKCELVWEEKDFSFNQFCETCNRICPNNNERRRYYNLFVGYCAELFYLKYPEPNHSPVSIPSDNEGKKNMIKEAKRVVGIGIESNEEQKNYHKKNNNCKCINK